MYLLPHCSWRTTNCMHNFVGAHTRKSGIICDVATALKAVISVLIKCTIDTWYHVSEISIKRRQPCIRRVQLQVGNVIRLPKIPESWTQSSGDKACLLTLGVCYGNLNLDTGFNGDGGDLLHHFRWAEQVDHLLVNSQLKSVPGVGSFKLGSVEM